MEQLGKTLVFAGIFLLMLGLFIVMVSKISIGGFSFGKLPGDIFIKRKNFVFYFPLTTSIILSVLLSLVLYLFSRH